jgi:hypothetical protein
VPLPLDSSPGLRFVFWRFGARRAELGALVRAELNFADLFVSRELKGSSVFGFVRIRPHLCVSSPPGSVSSRTFIVLTI